MLKEYLKLPRAIHILCLGAFINRAGAFLAPFLTLYLQKELNLDIAFATRAMGVYGVGAMGAVLTGGHLADKIGRRTVMLMSLVCGAAVLMIFGSLTTEWTIMGALLAFSFVAEMYRPAASAMIADLVEPQRRPLSFGLMYVAINLGFAVAALVGGKLATYSFQWLFWGDALTAVVYAIIIFLTIAETLPSRKPAASSVASNSSDEPDPTDPSDDVGVVEALKHILTDTTFVIYWMATFCLTIMYLQSFSTFPIHLSALGFSLETYGRLIAVNGLMIVFLQLPVTAFITRFPRGAMVTLSAVVTSVGFGLIGPATATWHFVLTTMIWTCGEMMNAPLMQSIVSDLAPVRLRARYMGVFSMCFSSAVMVGAPLGGIVLKRFGGDWLWGGSALAGLLAAGAYWCMRHRIKAPGERTTA